MFTEKATQFGKAVVYAIALSVAFMTFAYMYRDSVESSLVANGPQMCSVLIVNSGTEMLVRTPDGEQSHVALRGILAPTEEPLASLSRSYLATLAGRQVWGLPSGVFGL